MKSSVWLLLLLLATLTGCVRVAVGESIPTIGDQLMALSQAREIGAITQVEFDRLRRDVMLSITR